MSRELETWEDIMRAEICDSHDEIDLLKKIAILLVNIHEKVKDIDNAI